MKSIRRTINLPTVLLAVGLLALIAYQAGAVRQGTSAPTVVVSVNLARILDGLDQRAVAQADFVAMAEAILAEDEARTTRIEEMGKSLEDVPQSDTAERNALVDEIELMILETQGWRQFKTEQIDIEKSLLMRDMYKSVRDAIRELCEREGYDVVIVDDSDDELVVNPQVAAPREIQIKQQLNSRRLLYVSPSIDITNDVITFMNNAFNNVTP